MKKVILGRTGIEVTQLCFGALPVGPTQKDMSVEDGAAVIAHALSCGVNFVDTAQLYGTYAMIRRAIEMTGVTPVISSKAYAESYEDMDLAVNKAFNELGVEYIDMFLLHAARVGDDVFEQRRGAWECLAEYKSKGLIKAVGIATHAVPVVKIAAMRDDVDIVFPIINITGAGILRGSKAEMEDAIGLCHENGKGVFLMKALAGGNLINDYVAAMEYVKNFSAGRFSTAMGMVSAREVDMNIACFNNEDISGYLPKTTVKQKEFVVLDGICTRCGKCVKVCHSDAVVLTEGATRAVIDNEKCLKCGYCVAACETFCIRMI